uniref:Uncharacterized protein n=1 Tax=Ditylenchus dipsaci TaxID=166011 RepID=A0A915DW33_9BILA
MLGYLVWLFATVIGVYLLVRKSIESIVVGLIKEKPVLITGCDSGFGFDLALKCLFNGIPVFAAFLMEEGRDHFVRKAEKLFGHKTFLKTFILDVRHKDSVEQAKKFVEDNLGDYKGLHALVNNAGVVGNVAWDDWLTPEDYENVWQVNTLGVIRVTHAFKHLVKGMKGRIITTASVCGRVALPAIGPYNVSKFAVEAYCDTIRVELGRFGVKVVILEPGFFKTPLTNAERNAQMLENVWKRLPKAVQEEYGPELFEFSKKKVMHHLSDNLCPNTEWVVDAYFHAITSILPRKRYQIGYDANLFFIPFSMIHTEVQDAFYWLLTLIENPPKPKILCN